MLLSSLQGQPEGGVTVAIQGLPDDAARHPPDLLLAGCEERRRGAAEPHRHAEALHGANHHIRTELARRPGGNERQRIGRHDEMRSVLVHSLPYAGVVMEGPLRVRILHKSTAELWHCREVRAFVVADNELHAEVMSPCFHHLDALWVHLLADEELVLRLRVHGPGDHRHGLGGRAAFIEERGVGNLHTRELTDERLEVDEGLHAALRNLGLVRRVRSVPARVLQQVAGDDARNQRAVVAHADKVLRDDVLRQDGLDQGEGTRLPQLPIGQLQR
mmetsp:Transcript_43100/g.91849  ORF Transcript_43100/g.91849 Transcript_43100/m.91849 type:complete len:274 (+) Transcript_43100:1970-2791(+)